MQAEARDLFIQYGPFTKEERMNLNGRLSQCQEGMKSDIVEGVDKVKTVFFSKISALIIAQKMAATAYLCCPPILSNKSLPFGQRLT